MTGFSSQNAVVAVLGLGLLAVIGTCGRARTESVKAPKRVLEMPNPSADDAKPGAVVIDLRGAVKNQGVYELKRGARMRDLIQLCGGLSATADEDRVNWAAALKDGSLIIVPEKAAPPTPPTKAPRGSVARAPLTSDGPVLPAAGGSRLPRTADVPIIEAPPFRKTSADKSLLDSANFAKSRGSGRAKSEPVPASVNLNLATHAELEALPGIGPALAESIVKVRTRLGSFRSMEDLRLVPGLTDSTIAKFKDRAAL